MLQLFLTHLQGYKRQAVWSPILIVVEVICELLLPLVMGQEGIYYAEVGAWTAAAILLVAAYYARMRALSRRKGFALDEKN